MVLNMLLDKVMKMTRIMKVINCNVIYITYTPKHILISCIYKYKYRDSSNSSRFIEMSIKSIQIIPSDKEFKSSLPLKIWEIKVQKFPWYKPSYNDNFDLLINTNKELTNCLDSLIETNCGDLTLKFSSKSESQRASESPDIEFQVLSFIIFNRSVILKNAFLKGKRSEDKLKLDCLPFKRHLVLIVLKYLYSTDMTIELPLSEIFELFLLFERLEISDISPIFGNFLQLINKKNVIEVLENVCEIKVLFDTNIFDFIQNKCIEIISKSYIEDSAKLMSENQTIYQGEECYDTLIPGAGIRHLSDNKVFCCKHGPESKNPYLTQWKKDDEPIYYLNRASLCICKVRSSGVNPKEQFNTFNYEVQFCCEHRHKIREKHPKSKTESIVKQTKSNLEQFKSLSIENQKLVTERMIN